MNQDKVYIIGAGAQGRVVLDILLRTGYEVLGFFDDNEALVGKDVLEIPVIGKIIETKSIDGKYVVAIGDNRLRKKIVEDLAFGRERYITVVNPTVYVASRVSIGEGSMILGNVVINTCTTIGRHVILGTSCSISHDNLVGDFVHVSGGSHTGGGASIDEGSFLGIGVSVIPQVKIGKWSIIGSGTVVIKDVPDYATVVGVPGRVIKINYV
jgi:sugar O-acyltransferase (sialic acid O-acetyltransferase NeuD family)